MYDIIFISYQEPNADKNYSLLKEKFPFVKRVHGIKGIHKAHIQAAKKSLTNMLWIVDGDAVVLDNFNFEYKVSKYDLDCVHVWQSKNPLNDLVYGYGGIKLFPKDMTINMDVTKADMTTSISKKFKAMQDISNITEFNTGEFETWKSAFRECAKLASKTIDRQNEEETNERLKVWTTVANGKFSEYALRGARAGMEFGLSNKSDISLINNFDWLREKFDD